MKLTKAQTAALLSATFNPNARGDGMGAYVVMTCHGRTRKSLHDMGLMTGHYYLTRKGVETLAEMAGNEVDMYGYAWEGDIIIRAVVIDGDEPNTWAPDFSADGARECYYGCSVTPVAVFVDYVGRTEGVCAAHRERIEGQTYELPTVATVEPYADAESVCTATTDNPDCLHCERVAMDRVDNSEAVRELMNAMEESSMDVQVFIPRTHALDMGTRGYNRFVGIGVREDGTAYTYGLATAISAAPGMNGTGQHNIPTEFGDVITIATPQGKRRFVVTPNTYMGGQQKGDPFLIEYMSDDEKCVICETHGDNSLPASVIDGKHVCGYCVANECSPSTLDTHSLTFYVETEKAGTKYECGKCGCIDTRSNFARYSCEETTLDAGFVETDSTDDYSAVAALSTGAGFHTVADSVSATPAAPVATGTTHHTMDAHGAQWERFEHVLSVGDVVKVVGRQGVYEVHCLIPGLPVVYVLGTQGEPFPVPATDVYAL